MRLIHLLLCKVLCYYIAISPLRIRYAYFNCAYVKRINVSLFATLSSAIIIAYKQTKRMVHSFILPPYEFVVVVVAAAAITILAHLPACKIQSIQLNRSRFL